MTSLFLKPQQWWHQWTDWYAKTFLRVCNHRWLKPSSEVYGPGDLLDEGEAITPETVVSERRFRFTFQRFLIHFEDLWQWPANKIGVVLNVFYGLISILLTIGSAVVHPMPFAPSVFLFLACVCAATQIVESVINTAGAFRHDAQPESKRIFQSTKPKKLQRAWNFFVSFFIPIVPVSIITSSIAQMVWKLGTTFLLLKAAGISPMLALIIGASYASLSGLGNYISDEKNFRLARGKKSPSSLNISGMGLKIITGVCNVTTTFFALLVNHAPLSLNLLIIIFQTVERFIYCSSTFQSETEKGISKSLNEMLEKDQKSYFCFENHRAVRIYQFIAVPSILFAGIAQGISRYTVAMLMLQELGLHQNLSLHMIAISIALITGVATMLFDRSHYHRAKHNLIRRAYGIQSTDTLPQPSEGEGPVLATTFKWVTQSLPAGLPANLHGQYAFTALEETPPGSAASGETTGSMA